MQSPRELQSPDDFEQTARTQLCKLIDPSDQREQQQQPTGFTILATPVCFEPTSARNAVLGSQFSSSSFSIAITF